MTQALINLNVKENEVVNKFSKKWKISKADTIKKIIIDFKENVKL